MNPPLVPLERILLPVMHLKSGIAGTILHWITNKPKKQKSKSKLRNPKSTKQKRKLRPREKVVTYTESASDDDSGSDIESEYEPPGANFKKRTNEPYGEGNLNALNFLKKKFHKFSPISPQGKQVNKLIEANEAFCKTLEPHQKEVWMAFSAVVTGFLGRNRDPNYRILVEHLMSKMEENGIRCTPKVHIVESLV